MKRQKFRASRSRERTEFRQGLRVENGTANRLLSLMVLMKLKSFRALRGRGGDEFTQGLRVENGTANRLLLSLMVLINLKSFRASRGRGEGDEFRQKLRVEKESSSFSHNLMKRQKFRASLDRGTTEFRRGLRVEKGNTNRLVSLMI